MDQDDLYAVFDEDGCNRPILLLKLFVVRQNLEPTWFNILHVSLLTCTSRPARLVAMMMSPESMTVFSLKHSAA